MCSNLNVIFAGLLQFFKPVLSLTGVDGWRRSHANTLLAVGSLGYRLHGVKMLGRRRQVAIKDTAAVGAFDWSNDAATHAVRAWWHSLYFVVVTQQLKEREKVCFFISFNLVRLLRGRETVKNNTLNVNLIPCISLYYILATKDYFHHWFICKFITNYQLII